MVVALAPIEREAAIERLVVSTYQSVSGTGREAIKELHAQTTAVLAGEEPPIEKFPHQIAFNVIPQVENFADGDDYTTEERKVMRETRKILGRSEDELAISATCVRVPVVTGHSESINVQTRDDLSPEDCRELLAAAPGVIVVDSPGRGHLPARDRRRRARRGARRPDPPRPLARALASTSGSSATTCARARRRTRSRSPSS